jgi:hypothetical protein
MVTEVRRVYLDKKENVVPADSPEAWSWIETEYDGDKLIQESWGFTKKAEKEFTGKARKGRKEKSTKIEHEYWPRKPMK